MMNIIKLLHLNLYIDTKINLIVIIVINKFFHHLNSTLIFQLLIFILPLAITATEEINNKKLTNPNDEPFLPINPDYLYSPKLIKRGVEKDINEMISQLNPEIYSRQAAAKETVGPNYNENNYHHGIQANIALIQSSSLSSSGLPLSYDIPPVPMRTMMPPIYGSVTQSQRQGNPLYAAGQNGYSTYYNPTSYSSQQSAVPVQQQQHQQQAQIIPQYNQYSSQNYYSSQQQQQHPYMAYSSAPPSAPQEEPENPMMLMEMPDEKYTRPRGKIQDTRIINDMRDGQFTDGINYISSNQKDLDTQSTTYKQPSTYNLLNVQSDLHLRSAQLPKNSLRYTSNDGNNFQLPPNYKQQLDHIMSQALAKLLMQNGAINQGQNNNQYDFNQGQNPVKPLTQPGQIIAKTGLAYVMNPSTFHVLPRHVSKNQDSSQVIQVPSSGYGRIRKPTTSVSVEPSQSYYIKPVKSVKNHPATLTTMDFMNYDYPGEHVYDTEPIPSFDSNRTMSHYSPSDEVYSSYPGPPMYEYSNYHHPMLRNFKTMLDDDYESKRSSKRSPKFVFSS